MASLDDCELELYTAYPCYIEPGAHWPTHAHSHHELVLVQKGQYLSRVAGKERFNGPGDVLLYTAGTVHEEWVVDESPVLTWSCCFWGSCFGSHESVFRHDVHGTIQDLLAKLSGYYLQHEWNNGFNQLFQQVLHEMVVELGRLPSWDSHTMVDRVRAYIRSRLTEDFTVRSLASVAGLSKAYFARQYSALTGRTPMGDVRFLRIEEAARLITTTQLPLHEVAPMVGMANAYHLSRLLKTLLGVGVRELRLPSHHDNHSFPSGTKRPQK